MAPQFTQSCGPKVCQVSPRDTPVAARLKQTELNDTIKLLIISYGKQQVRLEIDIQVLLDKTQKFCFTLYTKLALEIENAFNKDHNNLPLPL